MLFGTSDNKELNMSKLHLYLLFLLPILLLPHFGISQTIRNSNSKLMVRIKGGEIRDNNSTKIGTIYNDGVVRNSNHKKLGTIQDGKVVNGNGLTIFRYNGSGTVRDKTSRIIYRIGSNGDIRNSSSQLILKYENIEITHLIGYLCFFHYDINGYL